MSPRSPWLARLAGDPLRAGDLYYQQGRLAMAADMYRRAKRFDQAARVCLEMGDRDGALALYLEAGDHLRAGELLAQEGDHKAAIPYFETARAFVKAAESSLVLKENARAARFFERAGLLDRAAACFEKGGELDEAMRLLEKESRSLSGKIRVAGDESLKDKQRQIDAQRATLLVRLGRGAEAAELMLVQGSTVRAAELLEKSGDVERAVRAWVAAGQPDRALPLLSRAGSLPAEERARIYRQALHYREAAVLFVAGGCHAEAAECWEAAGESSEAAPMWEAAGEMERAGEAYSRGEQWKDAARCYEAAGKLELAAESYAHVPDEAAAARCYLAAERPLRAAQGFLDAGDRGSAAQALQLIAEDHPDFERATLLLVPLLIDEGVFDGALHRLSLLPQETTLTGGTTVDRYYWEGRALEGAGRISEAAHAYQRTVAMRRDYRDASGRLAAVRDRLAREPVRDPSRDSGTTTSQRMRLDATPSGGTPLAELRPGVVLADRYRLIGELGRGGMGRVYKAEDQELGDTVALKTLLGAFDPSDQDRLLREVQICRRITHPNVVRVFDLGRFPGGLFVTMEYLEGRTLDQELRAVGPMPLSRVRELLAQLLAGLEEAHQRRVIHRDLKPSNVFLTVDRAKILDFGIARQEGRDTNLTQTGEVVGSPKYMSPEQIEGEELDGRSDLYALGVLAYAMLAGREPFTGKTPSAIALAQLREPPPDIVQFRPELPAEWQALVARLLEKERDRRFPGASEARAAVLALSV